MQATAQAPELEIPGYGCEDHFLEPDTVHHSWEVLGHILQDKSCHGVLADIGLPVIHRGVRYNCRAFVLDGHAAAAAAQDASC